MRLTNNTPGAHKALVYLDSRPLCWAIMVDDERGEAEVVLRGSDGKAQHDGETVATKLLKGDVRIIAEPTEAQRGEFHRLLRECGDD